MDDVFQDLPKKKNFVVVVKKKMFYSEGDDLGFLSYVYKLKGPFIPLTRIDEAGVYPPIAGTPLATRQVHTLTFVCTKLDRQIKIDEVYLKGPLPAATRNDIQVGSIMMKKAVILGPFDQLTVKPTVAFADQTVEIMCFQDLLKKPSDPNKHFATMFAPSAVEYLLLEGLSQTDYITLPSFTPKERCVLQTRWPSGVARFNIPSHY
nr:unnamed protein product [Spirometra erinaceieuropaei]